MAIPGLRSGSPRGRAQRDLTEAPGRGWGCHLAVASVSASLQQRLHLPLDGGGVEGEVLFGEPLRHSFVTDSVTALSDVEGGEKKW